MKYNRVRFKANEDDYRPVLWPPLGPYWCSGYGEGYSIIVAYIPAQTTIEELKRYWPELRDLDVMEENVDISYSGRFPKPEWFKP